VRTLLPERARGNSGWSYRRIRGELTGRFDGIYHDDPAIIIEERAFHGVQHYLAAHGTAQIVLPYVISAYQGE
jgi:hypothetical protein